MAEKIKKNNIISPVSDVVQRFDSFLSQLKLPPLIYEERRAYRLFNVLFQKQRKINIII